jgi:hypothetical protein
MTSDSAVFVSMLAAILVASAALAQSPDPEDRNAPIVLRLEEEGEGAPSKAGLGKTALLTDLAEGDPWYAAVKIISTSCPVELIQVKPWNADRAFEQLARSKPEFVIGVFRPEQLDVNFHFDFLERAAKLDRDPFVDFAFGWVTGATPDEAAAFAARICAARKGTVEKRILEFGPVPKPAPPTSPTPHGFAKGFKVVRLDHPEKDPDVARKLAVIDGIGIYLASGHGMPDGVDGGVKGSELRAAKVDLGGALYFSGPCYCGVPDRWFDPAGGSVKEAHVKPADSFVLALIHSKIGAVFAGLDPDRGETNHHELEHVLTTGRALGHATKSTYDDVVLAYRRQALKLPRYVAGEKSPHRDIADTMISGGACRALFGLPTWAPVAKASDEAFQAKARVTPKGIALDWVQDGALGAFWMPVDVYRAEGGWTHRLRFTCRVPIDEARKIRKLSVLSVTKDGKDLPYVFPTAGVEVFGGEAILHVMLIFPRDEKNRALWGGKKLEAHFLLGP